MSTAPIRVLHIIGIVNGGGVESVVMNYYKHIDRSKVQFDFVVHNNDDVDITDMVESMGGKVYKIPAYASNIVGFMHSIYTIVKEHKYKIVHCHMTTLGIFSLLPAWLGGADVRILHGHSTTVKSETKRNMMKLVLRPFSVAVANRRFACSQLAGRWLFGNRSFRVINNGIDAELFQFCENHRQSLRHELGLDGRFVIGHIGRFMYQKNHDYVIRVFYEVLKRIPSAHLVLVGDGPLREAVRDQVQSLGIAKHVTFVGVRHDVNRFYSLFDICYLPSWYEGLGVVAIESQAAHLPILLSNYVPSEAILDDALAMQISITNEDIDLWASETERIYHKVSQEPTYMECRNGINDAINAKGYNIEFEARKLEDLYCEYNRD